MKRNDVGCAITNLPSVPIGDRQLFGWEQRNDRASLIRNGHFLFDFGGRVAVRSRAIGFERDTMPVLISMGFSRLTTRLMIGRSCRARPSPCPNCNPNAESSSGNPRLSAVGQTFATTSVPTPGLISAIALSSHSRHCL